MEEASGQEFGRTAWDPDVLCRIIRPATTAANIWGRDQFDLDYYS
jgi:hypothetical protein